MQKLFEAEAPGKYDTAAQQWQQKDEKCNYFELIMKKNHIG